MNLKGLMNRAKKVVEDRGGTDALKQDAEELRRIAQEKGSVPDKARKAADAVRDPGAAGQAPKPDAAPPAAPPPTAPAPAAAPPTAGPASTDAPTEPGSAPGISPPEDSRPA